MPKQAEEEMQKLHEEKKELNRKLLFTKGKLENRETYYWRAAEQFRRGLSEK